MNKISRRGFLKLSAGTAVALGAPTLLTACGGEKPTPTPPALVAAIRGDDLSVMTREALEAVGGIRSIVNAGETVFIKPNMVTLPFAEPGHNPCAVGECAKPEIVIAVAEACMEAGASEVVIGDGSQMPRFDWSMATTLDASTDLAREAALLGVEYGGSVSVACLQADSPGWVEIPSRTDLGQIAISSLVAHADRVISIPVAKTHRWAQLTLSMKNFIGVTPLDRYAEWLSTGDNAGFWHRGAAFDHSSPESIAQIYLDIVDAVRPDLTIVDFSVGIEGDGPGLAQGGKTVDMRDRLGSWLLLASTDVVAADATAARIMHHDVDQVKQLGMAYEMGLGEVSEASIEIDGDRLDDLRVDWQHAKPASADQDLHGPGT